MVLSESFETLALTGDSSARSMNSHVSIYSTIHFGNDGIPLPKAISLAGFDTDSAAAYDRGLGSRSLSDLAGSSCKVLILAGSSKPGPAKF